ncbi:MAG: 23S rRNA (guanosine(2251)-2'-O)-methyltransferase RlmB [Bacteroidales bacterium]
MAKNVGLIFGIHPVLEAVRSGKEIDKILVHRGKISELMKGLLEEVALREIPLQRVPTEKLNRLTTGNHQGVIAWLSLISYSQLDQLLPTIYEAGEDPFILLLDGVSDVRNFGAIARSASCAGAHAVVIPVAGSAAINADAVKTSAGALHHLHVCRVRDLISAVRFLRDSGLRIVAATEKGNTTLYETDLTGPLAIVMGSEERGISQAVLKEADVLASIPMAGKVASLNVSVASGIMLFEATRQRKH